MTAIIKITKNKNDDDVDIEVKCENKDEIFIVSEMIALYLESKKEGGFIEAFKSVKS